MTALAACPWCEDGGNVAAISTSIEWKPLFQVCCEDCDAQGPSAPTKEEAEAEWNRRAPSVTPSPADLKALVGAARRTRMFMEDMGISKSVVDGFLAAALAPFEGSKL